MFHFCWDAELVTVDHWFPNQSASSLMGYFFPLISLSKKKKIQPSLPVFLSSVIHGHSYLIRNTGTTEQPRTAIHLGLCLRQKLNLSYFNLKVSPTWRSPGNNAMLNYVMYYFKL